ncbi:hypothetical protein CRE_15213 [Caenorhabditis remanei]|uniref:CCHC-type domain-containing protein n=1 Tax=Caenorhabditis remanei TaxID=31234 RepID=E3NSX5_CAERE|nr:hypothetical protein CRE_15213 [Caenorhabditis remanei]
MTTYQSTLYTSQHYTTVPTTSHPKVITKWSNISDLRSTRHGSTSRRNSKASKKSSGKSGKSKKSKSSSSSAKQKASWINLGPAKKKFTDRAKKTARLIKKVQSTLNDPHQPNTVGSLQANHQKLSNQCLQLKQSDSEALELVLQHPALSSNSQTRIKNVLELCNHIKERDYPTLIKELEDLLKQIEAMLQDLVQTQPLASKRTTNDIPIHNHLAASGIHSITSTQTDNSRNSANSQEPHQEEQKHQPPTTTNTGGHSSTEPKGPVLSKIQSDPVPVEPIVSTSDLSPRTATHCPTTDNALPPPKAYSEIEAMFSKFSKLIQTEITQKFDATIQKMDGKIGRCAETQDALFQSLQAMRTNLEIVQDQMEQQQAPNRFDQSLESIDAPLRGQDTTQWCLSSQSTKAQNNSNSAQAKLKLPDYTEPMVQSPSPVRHSPTTPHGGYTADINTILNTLKPFSGAPEHYSLFITRFNSLVHNNPAIDIIMKQNILISLLEGESKELITSDDLSEWAYNDLRTNLEDVYNTKFDRRKQLIETYRDLPFHQTEFDQMNRDLMKHICTTNSLQKYGISINDPFLIDSFVDKLPSRIMQPVIKNIRNKTPSFMDVANLVRSLISEHRAVDEAEKRKKNRTQVNEVCTAEINKISTPSSAPARQNYRQNKGHHPTTTISKWRSAPCTFCHKDHAACDCKLPPTEKRNSIMQQHLCYNCFRNTHTVKNCTSKFVCNRCHRKHHSAICPETDNGDTPVNTIVTDENTKQFFRNNGVDI